ncbi:hypothetical protein [Kitasatospora sp. KL5]|uniref:hypothetical protein n=1 Tax=Kitasatospora sp. KL5 TaxID=3425125 RepID=UPI003D6EBF7E
MAELRRPTQYVMRAAGVALLLGTAVATWLAGGARLAATTGLGGTDGIFTVGHCWEDQDFGSACRGTYAAPAGERRATVLHEPAEIHHEGVGRPVRIVQGGAYETSSGGALSFGFVTAAVFATGALPAHWLLRSAARRELQDGSDYVGAWIAALVGAIAVGIVLGTVVFLCMLVF